MSIEERTWQAYLALGVENEAWAVSGRQRSCFERAKVLAQTFKSLWEESVAPIEPIPMPDMLTPHDPADEMPD